MIKEVSIDDKTIFPWQLSIQFYRKRCDHYPHSVRKEDKNIKQNTIAREFGP